MIRLPEVASILLATLLFGCGGKVVYSEGAGGSGGAASGSTSSTSKGTTSQTTANGSSGSAGISCTKVSFDFNAPIDTCAMMNTCDIIGTLPDGRGLRETCTIDGKTASCALFVDGVEVCACPPDRLNYSATCSNGTPTCIGWDVDYSDITSCHVK